MRRFLLIIGLVFPLTLHAEALSPWVQGVLEKADKGIAFAETRAPGTCDANNLLREVWENTNAIEEIFGSSTDIAEVKELSQERTLCFESDRRLFQQKMQLILEKMNDATTSCNLSSLKVLRSTMEFLRDAYLSFLNGAVDPSYKDDRLRRTYIFEDEAAWSTPPYADAVLDKTSEAELCPYVTDYGPHFLAVPGLPIGSAVPGAASSDIKSYGCDASVLVTLPADLQAEATELGRFIIGLDAFARPLYSSVSSSLYTINSIIAVLTGRKPPDSLPGPEPLPDHEKKVGCLRPLSPEEDSVLTPSEIEKILFAYPDYFDEENLRVDPSTGTPTYNPTADEVLPMGVLYRREGSSPIATIKNFIDKKEDMGVQRPLPNIFKESFVDMYSFVHQTLIESAALRYFAGNNERQTGLLEASNRESLELTESALNPLHLAVVSLTDVVDNFMAHEYVPSVGYFLARSCVDGHCQQTLKTILKRIHNPFCHPYISGDYTDAAAARKCFCDTTIMDSDRPFWDEYCTDTLTGDEIARYQGMPLEPVFACLSDEDEAAKIEEANRKREEELAKKLLED